ncbi:MAG TPA: HD-GYP domain-containing protein [Burkholderiales bacterium]
MLKTIAVSDLRPGMYIQEFSGAWSDHPFWRSKFVIKGEEQVRMILKSGIREVLIDTALGLDVAPAPAPTKPPPAPEAVAARPLPPRTVSMSDEMLRARKICNTARDAVATMLNEARMGQTISSEGVGALVADIASSVERNPGALISLARLKTADDYTYMHSVAVCALMVSLARQLGLNDAQTREAGVAGLLHDMGKAFVSADILNKPGKLTDAEFTEVKTHPERGHQVLADNGGVPAAALEVCLHHHEKMDGSGYPHRQKGEEISLLAKMGAVADVYDAVTSNRPYKSGWDPAEAIRRMTEWCNGHFDPRVFQAFVKGVGIYPTGSLVKLASGRLAVVVEQGAQSLLKPTVRAFFSTKSQHYILPEMIDLARNPNEKIVGAEDPATWGVKNLEQFWLD